MELHLAVVTTLFITVSSMRNYCNTVNGWGGTCSQQQQTYGIEAKCEVNLETCRCTQYRCTQDCDTHYWNATVEGIEGDRKRYDVDGWTYSPYNDDVTYPGYAVQSAFRKAVATGISCNCFSKNQTVSEYGCIVHTKTCWTFLTDKDVYYGYDHEWYEAWISDDSGYTGHYCCDYNRNTSLQLAWEKLINQSTSCVLTASTTASTIAIYSTSSKLNGICIIIVSVIATVIVCLFVKNKVKKPVITLLHSNDSAESESESKTENNPINQMVHKVGQYRVYDMTSIDSSVPNPSAPPMLEPSAPPMFEPSAPPMFEPSKFEPYAPPMVELSAPPMFEPYAPPMVEPSAPLIHESAMEDKVREEKVNQDVEQDECVVCMDGKREFAPKPCGHLCLCANCKDGLNGKCPMCRVQYQSIDRIYL